MKFRTQFESQQDNCTRETKYCDEWLIDPIDLNLKGPYGLNMYLNLAGCEIEKTSETH